MSDFDKPGDMKDPEDQPMQDSTRDEERREEAEEMRKLQDKEAKKSQN